MKRDRTSKIRGSVLPLLPLKSLQVLNYRHPLLVHQLIAECVAAVASAWSGCVINLASLICRQARIGGLFQDLHLPAKLHWIISLFVGAIITGEDPRPSP